MSRPTRIIIDAHALLHNVQCIRRLAPASALIAMVKANAYGCGISEVIPVLEGKVDTFGVASIDEALAIRALGAKTPCLLIQGVFSPEEWQQAAEHRFSCVIHQWHQIDWLLQQPLATPVRVWIKVNTGMQRLGFTPEQVSQVAHALQGCPWVEKKINVLTHFAHADEPTRSENQQQMALFQTLDKNLFIQCSMANSAAILSLPTAHFDAVRPGIMLYGVSPFVGSTGAELGLLPVMRFISAISAINHYPANSPVGYGGTWVTGRESVIGIVATGYGDGYPRHVPSGTPVWVDGKEVPLVGRVSMDMLAVDLTDHPAAKIGSPVELWGKHLAVERIAQAAGTIGYELYCQITARVRH